MLAEKIIRLNNITKKYDEHLAVNNLSLSIYKGEIFGLLGPNGAGKTTTILMMLGLIEPTSGSVKVLGYDATRNPIEVKKRVGYLPDDLGFYTNMTGLENLLFTASLNGIPKRIAKERAMMLLEKVGLKDAAHKKAGKYSRGMKQRLGLADVLMKEPEVVILDEPTLGIDPKGVQEIVQLIKQLNEEEGISVLLSSHQLHQVQQICDRVGIFVDGKLIAKGDIESLGKQLLLESPYVIQVAATPMTDMLINKLEQLNGVHRLKKSGDELLIYCKEDITASISKTVMENGASLHHISKKDFGLDEIYHRYFEGRDHHESA